MAEEGQTLAETVPEGKTRLTEDIRERCCLVILNSRHIPTSKMRDVQAWMRSIVSPAPVAFDEARAEQGFELFHGKAACSTCHNTADFTGPGTVTAVTHPGGGLAGGIKIPSLRGVAHTAPYLSNGSVATLVDAVEGVLGALKAVNPAMPTLSASEKAALVD